MSIEITSAEELFNLLAGDDEEVPSILIKGSKTSRHEETLQEQAEIAKLNKVEAWMESENSVTTDPEGFRSFGITLVTTVLEFHENSLRVGLVQKLTKLIVLWLKVTKSCRLVEASITGGEIVALLDLCFVKLSKHHVKASFEACMRFVSSMINCRPDEFLTYPLIIECCNKHVCRWSKVKRITDILSALPIALSARLHYASTNKEGVDVHVLAFVEKLFKKKQNPDVDFPSFAAACKSKESEIQLLKTLAAGLRTGKGMPLTISASKAWVQSVAERDPKQPGVSGKPILLAKQLLKGM